MILKELMQLCFNAGRDQTPDDEGWRHWWEVYGQERHDSFQGPMPVCSEHAMEDSDPIICEEGGIGACDQPARFWGTPEDESGEG